MYLVLSLGLWAIVWVLLVKLGGIRAGTALLFVCLFWVFWSSAVVIIDLRYGEILAELWGIRPMFVMGLGVLSFLVAAPVSTIAAKFLGHFDLHVFILRWTTVLVILLLGVDVALGLRKTASFTIPNIIYSLLFAVIASVAAFFIYLVGKNPRRLAFPICIALVALLLPVPSSISRARKVGALPSSTSNSHAVKHVILITIDALRHDAVTSCNPLRGVTSQMDRIARDGTTFRNAFSSAPWTLPAMASLMTGLSPRVHGAIGCYSSLGDGLDTMAQYMSEAGYRTAAVGNNIFLAPRTDMDRGFSEYRWYPVPIFKARSFDIGLAHWLWGVPLTVPASTEELTNFAIEWFKANAHDDSFFWIHYLDPHMPYAPPKEFLTQENYRPGRRPRFFDMDRARNGHIGRSQDERVWIRSLYDSEVRYVDYHVGRLLDALQDLGIYDDALIVLTSDHGEEFWDHGGFEHGHSVFNELIHVPLFVKLPKAHGGTTVDLYVSTNAVLPTILDVCGITNRTPDVLLPPLTNVLNDPHADFSEEPLFSGALLYYEPMESVIFDKMKFIRSEISDKEMLFNLIEDPGETCSILRERPEDAVRGRQMLDAMSTRASQVREKFGVDQHKDSEIPEYDLKVLQSVGYL